jgi:hypothetical protein
VTPAERARRLRLVGWAFAPGELWPAVMFGAQVDDDGFCHRLRLRVAWVAGPGVWSSAAIWPLLTPAREAAEL